MKGREKEKKLRKVSEENNIKEKNRKFDKEEKEIEGR